MLTCSNLNLTLGGNKIFTDFGVSLLPGSIYILKGNNACGKTSLLKSIIGLLELDSGAILWNNKITDISRYASYLGHENAIKKELSVMDNLELWAGLKKAYQLILPAMGQFKLIDIADVKCKYLSAGIQKKVALARMVISNTKLWLLDEPETNLDEEAREFLLKLLQVKISTGGMVIIASHNLEYYQKIPIINLSDFKYER
jgi:heme exporter protein A